MAERTYLCIDLKSFYASVECVERGLDAMTTNLVVADRDRSEKTICLAVSPSMKTLGVKNRCRVFQIPSSIDYIMATPRMQLYIDYSARIYSVYLKYISKEDIHVYSIDEAFMDITDYLGMYEMTAKELAIEIMDEIYRETRITSSCGIGTNLYLTKIALDISAKHAEDHIGILDEETFKRTLLDHRPLTDFWRIGPGLAGKLEKYGIFTMRQIAEADEDLLYSVFGVDAELLIDHANGIETTTMSDIKNYKSRTNCLSSGQVLPRGYAHDEGRLIVKEMMDLLCLELADKQLVAPSVTLYIGYEKQFGIPSVKGTQSFAVPTSSPKIMVAALSKLYDMITDETIPIRRVALNCNNVIKEGYEQLDLFGIAESSSRENRMQKTMLSIKKKYGKNSILKGMNLEKGGTTIERNEQIGGHKSGIKTSYDKGKPS